MTNKKEDKRRKVWEFEMLSSYFSLPCSSVWLLKAILIISHQKRQIVIPYRLKAE